MTNKAILVLKNKMELKNFKYIIVFFLFIQSCSYKGKHVDLVIHNARVHVMNDQLKITDAIAINDGKIIEVGPEREIMNRYTSDVDIDAQSKDVFPGFHDCHINIFQMAKQQLKINLSEVRSYYEMIGILEKYREKHHSKVLIGSGWSQNRWSNKTSINNQLLNKSFPTTPVAILRADGQAMLVNQAMMDFCGIDSSTIFKNEEGEKQTMGLLSKEEIKTVLPHLPPPSPEAIKKKLLFIQNRLIQAGITSIDEVDVTAKQRQILMQLSKDSLLKINVYAMLRPSKENIEFAKKQGHYQGYHLSIRSFYLKVDGSLKSQTACFLSPYTDKGDKRGELLKSPQEITRLAQLSKKLNYQLNARCIGDSACRTFLTIVDTILKGDKHQRWRLEKAQFISPEDYILFEKTGILPSVQPHDALHNYPWAANLIGKNRLKKEGFSYKTLHKKAGMILFGSNAPIGKYNPFTTLYAATHRKTIYDEPENGFLMQQSVSPDVALKAMTLWASFGTFQENKIGTIEKGKTANIIILGQPLSNTSNYRPNYAWKTIIDGKIVYSME